MVINTLKRSVIEWEMESRSKFHAFLYVELDLFQFSFNMFNNFLQTCIDQSTRANNCVLRNWKWRMGCENATPVLRIVFVSIYMCSVSIPLTTCTIADSNHAIHNFDRIFKNEMTDELEYRHPLCTSICLAWLYSICMFIFIRVCIAIDICYDQPIQRRSV